MRMLPLPAAETRRTLTSLHTGNTGSCRFAAGMAQKNSTGRFSADAVVQDMLFPVFFHFGNEGFILGTLVLRHEYEVIRHDLLK